MEILNQKQKREVVLTLLKEGKTFREIQRSAHVGPDFIVKVKKEEFGDDYIFENPRTRDSKNTQAIRLIRDGKEPMEVALDLNIDSDEVNKAFTHYLRLNKLGRYSKLLSPETQEKLDLILMIAEVFHKNGLNKKEEIFNTLTKLKDLENIQKRINYLRQVHSKLLKQIIGLQSQENNIKKHIRICNARNEYLLLNKRRMKKEVSEMEKRHDQLNRLIDDIFNIEAYRRLEETLNNNIENVILEEHTFIPLILMAVFEGLKSDPKKLKSFNAYCDRFFGEKLRPDNIEIRIEYLKNEKFWNDTSLLFQQLSKIYTMADFAFVLKEKYKLHKTSKNMIG